MKEALCIFLATGKTYTFRGVTIINDNQTQFTFAYEAVSDDIPKVANFIKNENFAGSSMWAYDDTGE